MILTSKIKFLGLQAFLGVIGCKKVDVQDIFVFKYLRLPPF